MRPSADPIRWQVILLQPSFPVLTTRAAHKRRTTHTLALLRPMVYGDCFFCRALHSFRFLSLICISLCVSARSSNSELISGDHIFWFAIWHNLSASFRHFLHTSFKILSFSTSLSSRMLKSKRSRFFPTFFLSRMKKQIVLISQWIYSD